VTSTKLAIAAQQQIWAIRGLMDDHLPRLVFCLHDLDHRGGNAERTREHWRGKDKNGNNKANHAGAAAKFRQLAAPQHSAARNGYAY
jgi:hypothetical protein